MSLVATIPVALLYMRKTLTYLSSYLRWSILFILTSVQNLHSFLKLVSDSTLQCSVEVWGPKLYISTNCECADSTKVSEDKLYHRLLKHLAIFSVKNGRPNDQDQDTTAENSYTKSNKSKKKSIEHFWPFNKSITLHHQGQCIKAVRTQEPLIVCLVGEFIYEKITFTSARRNRSLMYELISSANSKEAAKDKNNASETISMYKEDECGEWEEMEPRKRKRNLDSVFLAKGQVQKIVADLKCFLNSREWYYKREIPYQRGYLLYGPPGNGKSSIIRALASEFNLDICILSLSSNLTDYSLNNYVNSTPENSILLLEDVDAVFHSRQKENCNDEECSVTNAETQLSYGGRTTSSVTFSGLLNAIDGVAASEGRIIFMTTNYIDRLDPALIRPGRIDFKMSLGYPDDEQLKRVFLKNCCSDDNSNSLDCSLPLEFVREIRNFSDIKVSMAIVQGLFAMYRHEKDGKKIVAKVAEFFREQLYTKMNEKDEFDFYT